MPTASEAKRLVLERYWHDDLEGLKRYRIHKWGGTVDAGPIETFGSTLFFKRFSIRGLRYLHKPARARASVIQEEKLRQAGFIAAPVVGLIERRTCGVLLDSALICAELIGFHPLYLFLNDGKTRDAMTLQQRRGLATALGHQIGAWHNAGFFHGDMHSGNIMCTCEDNDFTFSWLDNEEGKQFQQLPLHKRLHDLDHISRSDYDIPLTDRFRFWEAYATECGFDPQTKKSMVRKIAGMTQRYRARKKRA